MHFLTVYVLGEQVVLLRGVTLHSPRHGLLCRLHFSSHHTHFLQPLLQLAVLSVRAWVGWELNPFAFLQPDPGPGPGPKP